MHRYIKLILLAMLSTVALAASPTSGVAATWAPSPAKVIPLSTNFSLTLGGEQVKCGETAGTSTLSKESGTWTVTPEFSECGSPQVKAGSAWTLTAINGKEATITIPKGETAGVNIELSAKCKIRIEEGATLGAAEDYLDGHDGLNEPSVLRIEEEKVPIVQSPKECLNSATQAKVSADFALLNFTDENKAVIIIGSSAGPFWRHRVIGEKTEGEKIEEKSPEQLQGEGGEQVLRGKIIGEKFEITVKSVQAKGAVYNNTLQGQAKLLLKYHEPVLTKPVFKECKVKIGESNEVKTEGHLAWPGMILTATPITEGAKELPKGTFTSITLSGSGCGVLAGKFEINGSMSVAIKPGTLDEWSTKPTIAFPGPIEQYFWNGKILVGVEPVLLFAGSPASLTGEIETKPATKEVAIFEK